MIDIIPLNVSSTKIVVPELNATLEDASRHFEAFMADRNSSEQLKESHECMSQIVGILKMLDMPGAIQLANEMVDLLEKILSAPDKTQDFALSALSHSLVAMPCYVEYMVDREQAMPLLTLAFTNELRTALRKPIIFESELAEYSLAGDFSVGGGAGEPASDLADQVKRYRQMYQVGLIGLLREDNLELKMQLMHRAVSRIAEAVGDSPIYGQWLLAQAVLEAFLAKDLELSFTRKRILSLIDGELRKFSTSADVSAITADPKLITELVYLVNISRCTHPAAANISSQLGLKPEGMSDRTLQRERNVMQGPNAETIMTMVKALKEELAQSKEILEIAAQDMGGTPDFGSLTSLFQKTSDILAVVGLTSASQILVKMRDNIQSWSNGEEYTRDQLLEVADGLLYVESTLLNLSRLDLNFEDIEQSDEAKRAIMAQSQLSEAEAIVIKEAQAGIAQAKKDINSFIESNYDKVHVQSVVEGLHSVKGGLAALSLTKATAVLKSCISFIDSIIDHGVQEDQADNILQTLADALISLEYYLSEMELYGDVPDSVLAVAEQSLSALGFPVS